jgi:predicted glycosyltransferase
MKILNDRYDTVLITGTGDIHSVMKEYKFKKYITSLEYASLFPNIFPPFFADQL